MCYYKFHTCRFCHNQYECALPNWACPTIGNDEDANMCDNCLARLERELQSLSDDEPLPKIDELLGDKDEQDN